MLRYYICILLFNIVEYNEYDNNVVNNFTVSNLFVMEITLLSIDISIELVVAQLPLQYQCIPWYNISIPWFFKLYYGI